MGNKNWESLENVIDNENFSWKVWEKPGDPHLIKRIQWGNEELKTVLQVFRDDWFGYGNMNKNLEEQLASYTGIENVILTNSGSAAIDVAVKALIHTKKWNRGDLILHPITTFPTSISSAISAGLVPVFVETTPNTYVIDADQIESAIEKYPEIKGAIIPHLLGNIPDMDRIKDILGYREIIEDSCDTLGGSFNGKNIGNFGTYTAFSFYSSHHITTGGVGGALATNDLELSDVAKSLIFWGRDFSKGDSFLNRYTYDTLGTDSQMSAIQAAFGLAQMKKSSEFIKGRKKQFEEIDEIFKGTSHFELPKSHPKADPSWFSYPLVVREEAPFTREDFSNYLRDKKIETRPIMCGNLLMQEAYKRIKYISLQDEFPIGNSIHERGLFIPAWGMPNDQKENYHEILRNFIDKN